MKKMVLFMLLSGILSAGVKKVGTTSGQFLKIGISARAIGMGEAFVAVADDASAFFYNPACLARVSKNEGLLNHTQWFAGINYEFAGIAKKTPRYGTFGLFFATLYTDAMAERTPLEPDGTGATFFNRDYTLGVSYARFITDKFSFGVNLKYIRLGLMGFTANSWATDVGTFYWTGWKSLRLGFRISNFGANAKFKKGEWISSESYPLPVNFALGTAMEIIESPSHTLTLAFTGIKHNDNDEAAMIGAEYWFAKRFALRVGQKINYDAETFSLGSGFRIPMGASTLKLDYAYSDFGFLQAAHRLSLGLEF